MVVAKYRVWLAAVLAASLLAACGDDGSGGDANAGGGGAVNNTPALTDVDVLLEGAPSNADLPDEGKADATYPDVYDALLEWQSPVKSQGQRGVCSIFSTVGLMEHLYIKEGTMLNPDFSEQYLQWSAKVEVGNFPNTSGSNARTNLAAIHDFGVVEESVWPYEPFAWNESNDPECTGDAMPTKCYTNGEPPEVALSAEKFKLPEGRWLSTRPRNIKGFMTQNEQAVVVGLTFFYQAWNHGGSTLPTSDEYFKKGYVLSPNAEDEQKSLEKRAGHSILLVGWDDTLEVAKRDAEGNVVVDANGEPVMEKGFFIFKNSWGTGSFGTENPYGAGYGYISMDYVEEHGSAYVSDLPELAPAVEICGDGADNDDNGQADCDDAACADFQACQPTSDVQTYTADPGQSIPDNDPEGLTSELEVTDSGAIQALSLSVDITHPYRGDLSAMLVHPSGELAIPFEADGSSGDDLVETFVVTAFDGMDAQGTWQLIVIDEANLDAGTLNSWSLEITY